MTSGLEKGLYVYRYGCKDLQDAIESGDAYQIGQEAKLSDGTAHGIQRILDVMQVTMDALSAISGIDWVVCWFDGADKQGVVSMTLRQGDLAEAEKQACKQGTPPGFYWHEKGISAPSAKAKSKWTRLDEGLSHGIDSADAIKALLLRWAEHEDEFDLQGFEHRQIFWFDGEREWSMKALSVRESGMRLNRRVVPTSKGMTVQEQEQFVTKLHGLNASFIFRDIFYSMALPEGCEIIKVSDPALTREGSQLECELIFNVQRNVDGKRVEDSGSLYMKFDLEQGRVEAVELYVLGEEYDIQVGEAMIEQELLAQTFGPMEP